MRLGRLRSINGYLSVMNLPLADMSLKDKLEDPKQDTSRRQLATLRSQYDACGFPKLGLLASARQFLVQGWERWLLRAWCCGNVAMWCQVA